MDIAMRINLCLDILLMGASATIFIFSDFNEVRAADVLNATLKVHFMENIFWNYFHWSIDHI